MYKTINIGIPKCLTDLIPEREISYNIRNRNKPFVNVELNVLKIHFPIYHWDLV